MKELSIHTILDSVPHRYPFMLIDRVTDYKENDFLRGYKNITFNEPFFNGHFPGNPVMPGVLMIEALAQASVVLATLTNGKRDDMLHFFAGIDDARFKRIVEPGDKLDLYVSLLKEKRGIWKMKAEASVGEELACSCVLTSAERKINRD